MVRRAAAAGLRVAPQTTGHAAGPLAARGLHDVVLVKTSALTGVRVDPVRRICRAEGGALWQPAVEAAGAVGLAALHGSSPDVGIAGSSLGGGIGWYARKLGLAANSITAVEVVLADGTSVRADAHADRELFWALRGGGGSFGVVTALEFSLYPVASAYAGMLVWDVSRAEEVLRRWAAWAATAPDEVTTAFRILRLPALPELPAPLRGRTVVVIHGAVIGDDEAGARTIGDLRALRPEIDTFTRMPAAALSRLHLDPEGGAPAVSDSVLLSGLPEWAVQAFLTEVGAGAATSLLSAELRQLGGALTRPHAGCGALSHLEGTFLAFGVALAVSPQAGAAGLADARRLTGSLAPRASGRSYLNMVDTAVDPRSGYSEWTYRQLSGIRSAVDPDGVFAANHPIPRLYEDGQASG